MLIGSILVIFLIVDMAIKHQDYGLLIGLAVYFFLVLLTSFVTFRLIDNTEGEIFQIIGEEDE